MTPMASFPWRLHLITDRVQAGGWDRMEATLAHLAHGLPAGSWLVHFREKDLPARESLFRIRRLQGLLEPKGVPLVVNDRLDLALAGEAAGLHLGEASLPPAEARRHWSGLLGLSRHAIEALASLEAGVVDYVFFSPIFDTPSKRAYGPPQGLDGLRKAVEASPVPVVALGGIDPTRAAAVRDAGAVGVAAIRAIWQSEAPLQAALDLIRPFL